jgi:hypothetical protein
MTPNGRDDEPVFAPTPQDYDMTRQRIRQRRKSKGRAVAIAAGGAAVAGIAALAVSLGGGSTLVLEQNQPAGGGTTAPTVAAPAPPVVTASRGPAASVGVAGGRSATPVASASPGSTLPPPVGSPQPQATTRPAEAGVTRSYSGDSNGGVHVGGTTCNDQVGDSGTHTQDTFCADGFASETRVDAQRRVPITSSVCENKGELSSRSLSFDTEREVDYAVYSGSTLVWRWSAGRPEPSSGRHDLAVDPGECWTWRTSWRAVDAQGRALHGDFILKTTSYAKELDPHYNPITYRFSL